MKSGPMCALLWRILTWCARRQVTVKAVKHIPAERDSRQIVQTRPDHSKRMVPSPRGLPGHMLKLAPVPSGPFCHQVQQQTTTVCVTCSRPQAWAVDALSLSWEDLDPHAFPPAAILGKVVEKLQDYQCNRIILIAPG